MVPFEKVAALDWANSCSETSTASRGFAGGVSGGGSYAACRGLSEPEAQAASNKTKIAATAPERVKIAKDRFIVATKTHLLSLTRHDSHRVGRCNASARAR